MGGTGSRSSYEYEETNPMPENRTQSHNDSEAPLRTGTFPKHQSHNNDIRHTNLINTYESWDEKIDHQETTNKRGSNRIDIFSVPKTYVSDPTMYQASRYPQNIGDSFYPSNTHFKNPLRHMVAEERLPKKVQVPTFSQEQQHQGIAATNSATGVQPRCDSRVSMREQTAPSSIPPPSAVTTTQFVSLKNRSLAHKNTGTGSHTTSAPASMEKPIYVDIDHQATLIERSKTVSLEHHRKNLDGHKFDGFNASTTNDRTRSQLNRHSTRYNPNDISNHSRVLPSSSFDLLSRKVSNLRNTPETTILVNTILHHNDDAQATSDVDGKSSKSRSERRHRHHQLPALSSRSSVPVESFTRHSENRHRNSSRKRFPQS